ncbi:MAG: hypothetical protein KDK48_06810, partial [Chlamydiia bacterium]|nr:hypothetical protein [Chlamydiia bacterium]
SDIGFSDNLEDPNIYVSILVSNDYLDRVREDTVATIQSQGLLGDKFMSLSAGVAESGELPEGTMLQSKEPADISLALQKAQGIVDNTNKISEAIYEVADQFRNETMNDLNQGAKSLASITQEIETGNGTMHRLIYSKKDADNIFDALASASTSLDSVMSEIRTGKGLIHALVYEDSGVQTLENLGIAAKNLAVTAEQITLVAQSITDGDGLLHELVYGKSEDFSAKLESIVDNLAKAAAGLKETSQALATGEGTIGALMVDPSLYDNLVDITDEAKRSLLLKAAIRGSLKK